MVWNVFTSIPTTAKNILKPNGIADNAINRILKPIQMPVDSFARSISTKTVDATTPEIAKKVINSNSKMVKVLTSPLTATSKLWHGLRDGVSFLNGKNSGNMFTKFSSLLFKKPGTLPFIGTAVVVGGVVIPGILKSISSLLNGKSDEAVNNATKTGITALIGAAAGICLTATGAGAAVAAIGTGIGAWIGNKAANKAAITSKTDSTANSENSKAISPANNQYESIVMKGFPKHSEYMNDAEFNDMIKFADAVAHF